ncbi:Amidohydrolase family protein [Mycobacterium tuberculosis]|nr:Amidohydrolase family protein [Mycobacterium tuberculosis]
MADADLVMTGTVLTVDDARPTAEAIAVADGRVIAVGDRSEVAGLVGANTRVIDLGAGCVMPGFVEAPAIRYWRRSCCRTGSSISVR